MKQSEQRERGKEGQEGKDPEKPRFLERERAGTFVLRPDDKGPRDTHALGKGGLRPEDGAPGRPCFLRSWGTGAKKNFSLVKIQFYILNFFFSYSRGQKKFPPSPNSSSKLLKFLQFISFKKISCSSPKKIFFILQERRAEGGGGNR